MSKLVHLSCSDIYGEVHDTTVSAVASLKLPNSAKLLDVGCWDGEMTLRYAEAAKLQQQNLRGIEIVKDEAEKAAKEFPVAIIDIEKDKFPYENNFFDVVIVNQVFEHLKNIYHPISETHRTLKLGGYLVFSVPNLSSLHNRLMLLAGRQPSSIRTLGPHVRGYAATEVTNFLELYNHFKVVKKLGTGFYPTISPITGFIAKNAPNLSHTIIFVAQKRNPTGPGWLQVINEMDLQSSF